MAERPVAPIILEDEKEHRRLIAQRANAGFPKDGTEAMQAPAKLREYTVATVPDATIYEGAIIYVSDETGGATIAFSDGTNWRRVQDRAIVA